MTTEAVKVRDRIKSLRRVRASDLIPHPKNWRRHPKAQQKAMRAALSEIGYADALLVRETKKGLQLIDGHLRAELDPDQKVPVLVLDVTAKEADKLLATFDPITGMAETDIEQLSALAGTLDFEVPELADMVADGLWSRILRYNRPNAFSISEDSIIPSTSQFIARRRNRSKVLMKLVVCLVRISVPYKSSDSPPSSRKSMLINIRANTSQSPPADCLNKSSI